MADFAGAPKSFAAQFEIPNDENISFPSACRLVAQCEAAQLQTRAIIEEKPEGLTKFIDLPVDFAGDKKQMHHLVDAIKNWQAPPLPDGSPNKDLRAIKDEIKGILNREKADLMRLPAPLCPKKRCINKFSMDFAVVRTETDGVFDIYKHFVFESPGVPVDVAKELCHGEALDINWGAAKKYGPRAFLVLWHNLLTTCC